MGQVSRRALLARAGVGVGTGTGVFALLAASAAPALAAPSAPDLANVRLVCVAKRIAINWDTQWVNTPAAADSATAGLIRAIRKQEQGHYNQLAPFLNGTAPVDDDYVYTLPKGALRSLQTAAAFAVNLESLLVGTVVGAITRVQDTDVKAALASILAADGQHLSALSVLSGGAALADGFPAGLGIDDAGNQLDQFISTEVAP